jgi:hypothetical protein
VGNSFTHTPDIRPVHIFHQGRRHLENTGADHPHSVENPAGLAVSKIQGSNKSVIPVFRVGGITFVMPSGNGFPIHLYIINGE